MEANSQVGARTWVRAGESVRFYQAAMFPLIFRLAFVVNLSDELRWRMEVVRPFFKGAT